MKLSPDGAMVLALTDKTLTAHDTIDGKISWQLPLSSEARREIIFSGDGRSAMVKGSRELSIVSAATGEILKSVPVEPDSRGLAMLLSDDAYAIGNVVYRRYDRVAISLPFVERPTPPFALPAVNASGRLIAGIRQGIDPSFAVIDLSIRESGNGLTPSPPTRVRIAPVSRVAAHRPGQLRIDRGKLLAVRSFNKIRCEPPP